MVEGRGSDRIGVYIGIQGDGRSGATRLDAGGTCSARTCTSLVVDMTVLTALFSFPEHRRLDGCMYDRGCLLVWRHVTSIRNFDRPVGHPFYFELPPYNIATSDN